MNQITQLADDLTRKYDSELFLGRLCWYSVPGTVAVTRDDFVKHLTDHGVTFGEKIPKIRSVDVFKRGAKDSERNKYRPSHEEKVLLHLPADCYINYLFRNASQDTNKVYRSLVREVVDSAGHKISLKEIVSLTYDRKAEKIDHTTLVVDTLGIEKLIVQTVYDYFHEEAERMTPPAISEFLRKSLEYELRAVKVRPSGGIYFTNEVFSDTVAALETVVNSIGATFHSLPLMDDSKQRAMLRKAFEDESFMDIQELLEELMEIKSSKRTITTDRMVDLKGRYVNMSAKIADYTNVLGEAMEKTASFLEVALIQMNDVENNHVKTKEDLFA